VQKVLNRIFNQERKHNHKPIILGILNHTFEEYLDQKIECKYKWSKDCIYSAFTDTMATNVFYMLPHIHLFTHSFIHWRQCQPGKAPSNSLGAAGVRSLAHGHHDTWSGGTRL